MAKTTQSKKTKSPSSKNMEQSGSDNSELKEFFIDELKDVLWAEKHIIKTLPKMKKAATTEDLKNAFEEHLEVTRTHVERLEQIFGILGEKVQAKTCEAIEGITKEGESIIDDTEDGSATRDVGLIMAAQKVEHYEISTYGGLAQLATTLGLKEVAGLLQSTLEEEKEADVKLTEIAESSVNVEAAHEPEKD